MAASPVAGVADAVLLGTAVAALLLAALASNQVEGDEGELVDALDRLLGWLDPVWTTCYTAAGPACVGLLVAALAVRRLEVDASRAGRARGPDAHARWTRSHRWRICCSSTPQSACSRAWYPCPAASGWRRRG
jgi:hypothetical protein